MANRLPLITTAATYILIILGVLVVGFDAGLACSDWPLCNGRIIPPMQGIIIVEFTHRIFSSLTGLLIVGNAIWLWRRFPHDRLVRVLAVLSVVLLGVVGVMGGVNVLNKLPSGLTAIDMASAMLLLAVLVVLTERVRSSNGAAQEDVAEGAEHRQTAAESERQRVMKKLYKPAVLAAVAIYFVTVAGGFLKHSGAAYNYVHPSEPLPNELVTDYSIAQLIVYIHMFATFLVVFALFWLLVYARKHKMFFRQTVGLMLLLGIQVFLGIFSLMTKLELLTTTAHMAVAAMMIWISVSIAASVKFGNGMPVARTQAKPGISQNRTVMGKPSP